MAQGMIASRFVAQEVYTRCRNGVPDATSLPEWSKLSDENKRLWEQVTDRLEHAVRSLLDEVAMARRAYTSLATEHRALRAARDENSDYILKLRDSLWAAQHQASVRAFMEKMGQPTPEAPTLDDYPFELRARLILEEAFEFVSACRLEPDSKKDIPKTHYLQTGTPDWPEMIDALCDLLYVTYGAAVSMGVDLDPFFALVHAANMKKADGPVREDGKKLKPPGWTPPDIAGLLDKMRTS